MVKSLILLSGGLDSLVSLGLKKDELNIDLGLTFDYGQKSAKQEIEASARICEYYGIQHKVISLDWLKDITQTSLVSDEAVPTGDALINPENSMKSVWVPNRNGLFLNIAGCFADSFGYDYILIGANKEEAQTFSDNRQEFIDAVNEEFKFSTQNTLLAGDFAVENDSEIIYPPRVVAPLINNDKNDIVMLALESHVPLELTRSCYQGGEKHCGICESCTRLKKALEANHDSKYIKVLFE